MFWQASKVSVYFHTEGFSVVCFFFLLLMLLLLLIILIFVVVAVRHYDFSTVRFWLHTLLSLVRLNPFSGVLAINQAKQIDYLKELFDETPRYYSLLTRKQKKKKRYSCSTRRKFVRQNTGGDGFERRHHRLVKVRRPLPPQTCFWSSPNFCFSQSCSNKKHFVGLLLLRESYRYQG
jgi:hypothetical protein